MIHTVLQDCNHYFHERCLERCRRNISGVNKEIKNYQNIKYSMENIYITFINYN